MIAVVDVDDPVGELATWAAATLVVPPGHPTFWPADGAPSVRRRVAPRGVGRA